MSVTVCQDESAAAWISAEASSWEQLVCLGPSGFSRYARLRFIPDPEYPGQRESDVPSAADALPEIEQLRTAVQLLRDHTSTPQSCFFALWEGWGVLPAGEVVRPVWRLPHRDYFLFRGPVDAIGDAAQWRAVLRSSRRSWWLPAPAFVWPQDRSWCVTKDVDPHYAGIAAAPEAIEELMAHPQLDVVVADPALVQPHYS